jgi:hypothetical protein
LYDIYIREINNHPYRVLDFLTSNTINDPVYWWKETDTFKHLKQININASKEAYNNALKGKYYDVHFSVFTPESFLMFLYNMFLFNLLPYRCIEFDKTDINTFEFNCVLEYDPNLLLEDSIDREKEKQNIINLLKKNYDFCSLNTKIENLETDLSNANTKIENLRTDLLNANTKIENLRTDLNTILSSKSWKITAPLRKIKNMLFKKRTLRITNGKSTPPPNHRFAGG